METLYKAIIYERLCGIYKSSVIHEEKLREINKLQQLPETNTKQIVQKYKAIRHAEPEYDKHLSRIDKNSCELIDKIENKERLNDVIENISDLLNDIVKLFLKQYFGAKNDFNAIAGLLVESENGTIEINSKKYDVYHS